MLCRKRCAWSFGIALNDRGVVCISPGHERSRHQMTIAGEVIVDGEVRVPCRGRLTVSQDGPSSCSYL